MKANGIKTALISEGDYYSKSVEFSVWLREEKDIFFQDLTTEQARAKFSLFVEKWNAGELREKYYKGMNSSSVEPSTRTKYKWNFASKLDPIELGSIRDTVDSDTNKDLLNMRRSNARADTKPPPQVLGPLAGPPKPGQEEIEDEEERRRLQHVAYKKDIKEYKKNKEFVLDELLPKATGREATMEKKKIRNDYHKKKDDSPEPDADSFMGGNDDFQTRLRQEKDRKEKRMMKQEEEYQKKMSDYQAKEDAKMAPLRALAQRFAQPPQ